MVDINDVSIHIFNEDTRSEVDLEYRLRNPPSEKDIE